MQCTLLASRLSALDVNMDPYSFSEMYSQSPRATAGINFRQTTHAHVATIKYIHTYFKLSPNEKGKHLMAIIMLATYVV